MSALTALIPVTELDEPFLAEIYASTRAAEMALVPWSDEQKRAFLQIQFEAQTRHYLTRYPNASFNLIKINDEFVGRLYLAELEDEIRIIDLTFLPERFDKDIFVRLLKEILQKGEKAEKVVQIYLESFNPQSEIFARLGFQKTVEHGIYFLWRHQPAVVEATVKTAALSA
jgi:hypothetical protein